MGCGIERETTFSLIVASLRSFFFNSGVDVLADIADLASKDVRLRDIQLESLDLPESCCKSRKQIIKPNLGN